MKLARWVFGVAGVYGLLILTPMYFLEERIGRDLPPPITHPDFFYGFIGVALAWQVAFLIIARDPARYRLMMIPAILEKATYVVALTILVTAGRIPIQVFRQCWPDLILGTLFAAAFVRTRPVTG